MRKFRLPSATAALLLAGCGFAPVRQISQPEIPIAIESNSAALQQLAIEQLGELMLDRQADTRLVLSEKTSENIVGRGSGGNANLVKISYRIDYRIESRDKGILHESVFRFSEKLAHDDAALRASLLSRERTFELTRKRALRKILQETAVVLAKIRTKP